MLACRWQVLFSLPEKEHSGRYVGFLSLIQLSQIGTADYGESTYASFFSFVSITYIMLCVYLLALKHIGGVHRKIPVTTNTGIMKIPTFK